MPNHERSGVKTLAIRLDEELHAQLTVVAQLAEITVTDAIRQAIEAYVEGQRTQADLANRASSVLEEIEREASARKGAIQALFGETGPTKGAAPARRRGRRSVEPEEPT